MKSGLLVGCQMKKKSLQKSFFRVENCLLLMFLFFVGFMDEFFFEKKRVYRGVMMGFDENLSLVKGSLINLWIKDFVMNDI